MPSVLIVDDSNFARAKLKSILLEAGYSIFEAVSGEQALELAHAQKPDLITLDLLMPGMTGHQALPLLRKICPKAQVIVVSSDVQGSTRVELISAGVRAFVVKPVKREDFLGLLAKLTGQV
jgi:two-component system chemotaxis response regulator CheY